MRVVQISSSIDDHQYCETIFKHYKIDSILVYFDFDIDPGSNETTGICYDLVDTPMCCGIW